MPIHTWHIVIGGFLQHEGKPTGMVALWRRLHELHARPGVCVELRSWNERWRDLAELIWRVQPRDEPPIVKVYAYSWGAGWGAMQLARQLALRGVNISAMVLSDPVYRSPWLPFRWLALVSWRAIRVPRNVRIVHWFRQRTSLPAGHDLMAVCGTRTLIAPAIHVEAAHQYMDDLRQFHRQCERVSSS